MPVKSPEEQQQLVKQFREECLAEGVFKPESEPARDDHILIRFLRARQYDFKASKLMLKNCEEWRASVGGGRGMEQLYKDIDPFDYPERDIVFKYWPLYFHKTDKKGRPVNIHKFGHINAAELLKQVPLERFMDIFTVNCDLLTREILPACSKAAGKRVETVLVIVDLKGFGISQFWAMKDLIRTSFQISQDYYPETMGQVAIINAPMTFTTMWSAIKPWLAKETVEKVDILGSDYQSALLKIVDADALPAELGGTCTCAEHGGDCATSNVGPWVEGRAERRAAWLRGERASIAEDVCQIPRAGAGPEEKTTVPGAHGGAQEAPEAPLEAAVGTELPNSASDTPATTPPAEDAAVPPAPSNPEETAPPQDVRDFAHETNPEDATATAEHALMPPAIAPAGYTNAQTTDLQRVSSPEGAPSASSTPDISSHSGKDTGPDPRSSARTSLSGVSADTEVRSARSATSRRSAKSARSVRSGFSSVFSRKSRASSRARSTYTDESDLDEGSRPPPAAKSRLRLTVDRVLDKVMGEGRMTMR